MAQLLKSIRSRFQSLCSSLNFPWAKVAASTPWMEADDPALPEALERRFASAIQDLVPPSAYVDEVIDALATALWRWQTCDTFQKNVLVMLSEPVQSTKLLLSEVCQHVDQSVEHFDGFCVYRLDSWLESPADYANVNQLLQEAIASILETIRRKNNLENAILQKAARKYPTIIAIPALEHYFLRYVDGLEAIETIRQAIIDHSNYFWLIGCNGWAWHYLDKVCYLSAYLGEPTELSALDALQIKKWLSPLERTMELSFFSGSDDSMEVNLQAASSSMSEQNQTNDLAEDWTSNGEKQYFETIQSASRGIASIAAAIWLYSLQYEPKDSENGPEEIDFASKDLTEIVALDIITRRHVSLPNTPTLTEDERFLLYALLLHGRLTSEHLAVSLAEPPGKIQAQLQALRRNRLITENSDGWSVNPIYFKGLRNDVKRNNFLIA